MINLMMGDCLERMKEIDDLDLLKAFAELEGLEITEGDGELLYWDKYSGYEEYNPITDLGLLAKYMLKYKVDVYHSLECVYIDKKDSKLPFTSFDKCGIERAVLTCILISEGEL